MKIMNKEEIANLEREEKIRYLSFGKDIKYFMIVGECLYHRAGENSEDYLLLEKNFKSRRITSLLQ